MIRPFLKLFFILSTLFLLAVLASAFALPILFDVIEFVLEQPLPYEAILRLSIAAWGGLLLLGALVWLLRHGQRRHWLLFILHGVSYVMLLVIFAGDTTHRLMEEFSWIRYTTSTFLFLASGSAFFVALLYKQEKKYSLSFFWMLVAGAFLYTGLDEVLEIHEALGRFIEQTLRLPHVTTDLITVGYALAALVVLGVFFRTFRGEYTERHRFPFFTFFFGGIVYFFSTMFDTIDMVVGKKLTSLAKVFSLDPSFVFSDAWFVVWAPKNFFNGVEEVFEHSAALLFFTAILLLLFEKKYAWIASVTTPRRWRFVLSWCVGGIATLLLVLILLPSLVNMFSLETVPLKYSDRNPSIQRIAGPFDGLQHTDDLFYHPKWGVLVANEGKGNVYQWKDNRWRELPDPKHVLRDTDSVTATDTAVYVSDGSRGAIVRYTNENGWEDLWTKSDGLKHPEGLVAVGSTLYVLDESERSITKLVPGAKPEVWKPSHRAWKAPEGIAWYPKTNVLLVTDDVSGVVFVVDFGKSVVSLAQFSKPEDIAVTDTGRILVSDNGWGAVFELTENGKQMRMARFLRSYRDVQGVTADEKGNVYVVTADGFDRISFMPSFLWKLK